MAPTCETAELFPAKRETAFKLACSLNQVEVIATNFENRAPKSGIWGSNWDGGGEALFHEINGW